MNDTHQGALHEWLLLHFSLRCSHTVSELLSTVEIHLDTSAHCHCVKCSQLAQLTYGAPDDPAMQRGHSCCSPGSHQVPWLTAAKERMWYQSRHSQQRHTPTPGPSPAGCQDRPLHLPPQAVHRCTRTVGAACALPDEPRHFSAPAQRNLQKLGERSESCQGSRQPPHRARVPGADGVQLGHCALGAAACRAVDAILKAPRSAERAAPRAGSQGRHHSPGRILSRCDHAAH